MSEKLPDIISENSVPNGTVTLIVLPPKKLSLEDSFLERPRRSLVRPLRVIMAHAGFISLSMVGSVLIPTLSYLYGREGNMTNVILGLSDNDLFAILGSIVIVLFGLVVALLYLAIINWGRGGK